MAGWWAIGGVELRPNMTSMLGRNAAPRAVERKSAGGSKFVKIRLAMGGLKATRKRNAPLTHERIYPPVRPVQSFVEELGRKWWKGKNGTRYSDLVEGSDTCVSVTYPGIIGSASNADNLLGKHT